MGRSSLKYFFLPFCWHRPEAAADDMTRAREKKTILSSHQKTRNTDSYPG